MRKTECVSGDTAARPGEMLRNGKSHDSALAPSNKCDLVLHSSAFHCLREQHFLTSNLNRLTCCCAALCSFTEQKIK